MSLFVRDTATRRLAVEGRILMTDGSKPIEKMLLRDATGLRQFYQRGIRPAATPDVLNGTSSTKRITYTPSTTIAVTGGTPPYSHSWSVQGLTPTAPTSNTTAFTIPRYYEDNVVATDTVRDANGLTATVGVTIFVFLGNDGGPLA